ncbi:MAG: universal stress protein [Synechococcales bacterium]|nr:universal stress protein [Synechococcales bacterium]
MFSRCLVALDLSAQNKVVFQLALELAQKTGASLMLVHVTSTEDPESPSMPTLISPDYSPAGATSVIEIYEKLWQAYEEKGYQMLQDFDDQALQAGITIEYAQHPGSPGKTLCKLAETQEADLIIIGRRGHSGWNELIAGSVSNYVMHYAPCSVLIVQNPRI